MKLIIFLLIIGVGLTLSKSRKKRSSVTTTAAPTSKPKPTTKGNIKLPKPTLSLFGGSKNAGTAETESSKEENGYGCLPVNNCEVKDENSPCSELQFLVHRSMQKILCCSLKSGWDTNKEMFNWNAIEAAANDVGEAERESRFFTHINKVSLVGGFYPGEGNVMIRGKPVCDDFWDDDDATVVCRMLGFSSGYAVKGSAYGDIKDDFIMTDVHCDGNEYNLLDCFHINSIVDDNMNCISREGAGVQCFSEVALSGGPTIHEGNVMVDGRPVCDDEWGGVQANVVCRMLGYAWGYATMDSAYGRVENDFIMDDVKCSGNEASLKQCGHSKRHNCGGGEAAGAICIPEGKIIECPGDWQLEGSECYHMSPDEMSWNDAKWYCEQRNGFLAEIRDSWQKYYVALNLDPVGFWIGLNDKIGEGRWRWSTGAELVFNAWNSSRGTKEDGDCVHLLENGKWSEAPCSLSKRALCQRRRIIA